MRQLPSGTVTFLFSDIEGSTQLLDDLGDAYTEALTEYRRVLRDALDRHDGTEVGTEGDGFVAAFTRATDAVAAAEDAQRALAEAPVRARMGIHTGEPTLTPEGYVGLDVHRAARVAGVGHGGQVVVSDRTRVLLDDRRDLVDLGEHRLKDLAAPIRLFQLGRDEFPPLRSLTHAALPTTGGPILGRKRELADLLRLLRVEGVRLVTITGPGGIGKTTLAVAAAEELSSAFADGIAFVDLSAVRDAALVLPTIAEALGTQGDPAGHVGTRELLVVLDNVEQVIEAAGGLASLLGAAPNLRILATSREPLRIAGEREFPLRPLAEAPAVELFRQRAEAVVPGFDAGYARLAEICRRLDSLPLAIELAAARVKVLPPGELLGRLDDRLALLTATRRDLPERQRTLRAAIEWSYELLSADEQRLFARLGAFSGGWSLDAAEKVCDANLDTLASLLDKSLIRRDGDRFSMLETIREYAVERLEESGEADGIRYRHAASLAELAEESEQDHLGPDQARLREQFRTEWDNVRAALEWTIAAGEIELGLRLAGALTMVWLDRNLAVEGERWFRTLFAAADGVDATIHAKALMTASMVAGVRSNFETAAEWSQDSLRRFRELGSEAGIAWSLINVALVPLELGDAQDAGPLLEEAEQLHRALGNEGAIRRVLHLRGQQAVGVGDLEGGRRLLQQSADLSEAAGDRFSAASSQHSLGDIALFAGDVDTAEAEYRRSLDTAWDTGAERLVCYGLAGLAAVAGARGQDEQAARLWGFVETYEERLRFTLRLRDLYKRHTASAVRMEPAAHAEGRGLDVEVVLESVLSRPPEAPS